MDKCFDKLVVGILQSLIAVNTAMISRLSEEFQIRGKVAFREARGKYRVHFPKIQTVFLLC